MVLNDEGFKATSAPLNRNAKLTCDDRPGNFVECDRVLVHGLGLISAPYDEVDGQQDEVSFWILRTYCGD